MSFDSSRKRNERPLFSNGGKNGYFEAVVMVAGRGKNELDAVFQVCKKNRETNFVEDTKIFPLKIKYDMAANDLKACPGKLLQCRIYPFDGGRSFRSKMPMETDLSYSAVPDIVFSTAIEVAKSKPQRQPNGPPAIKNTRNFSARNPIEECKEIDSAGDVATSATESVLPPRNGDEISTPSPKKLNYSHVKPTDEAMLFGTQARVVEANETHILINFGEEKNAKLTPTDNINLQLGEETAAQGTFDDVLKALEFVENVEADIKVFPDEKESKIVRIRPQVTGQVTEVVTDQQVPNQAVYDGQQGDDQHGYVGTHEQYADAAEVVNGQEYAAHGQEYAAHGQEYAAHDQEYAASGQEQNYVQEGVQQQVVPNTKINTQENELGPKSTVEEVISGTSVEGCQLQNADVSSDFNPMASELEYYEQDPGVPKVAEYCNDGQEYPLDPRLNVIVEVDETQEAAATCGGEAEAESTAINLIDCSPTELSVKMNANEQSLDLDERERLVNVAVDKCLEMMYYNDETSRMFVARDILETRGGMAQILNKFNNM